MQNLRAEAGLVTVFASAQHWGRTNPARFFEHLHGAICEALGEKAQPVQDYGGFHAFIHRHAARHRFVLELDEFEELAANPEFDADFFKNMRALGDDAGCRFGYLLASRLSLVEVCRQYDKVSSLFWNLFGSPFILGLLTPAEAERLVREPLRRSLGRELDKAQYRHILHHTGAHPGFIQLWLEAAWTAWEAGFEPDWERAVHGLSEYCAALWEPRSPEEYALLIGRASGKTPSPGPVLTELRLRGLVDWEGRSFSPFFAELIRRWRPPGEE